MEKRQLDLFGGAGITIEPPKKKTKTQQVREHLEHYGKITSWDAIRLYRATRLSAIIHNLRHKERISIRSVPRTSKEGAHYVEYQLVEVEQSKDF